MTLNYTIYHKQQWLIRSTYYRATLKNCHESLREFLPANSIVKGKPPGRPTA